MEFDDIRAFVAVADVRSVSRAARALYLTQPAVTRRMQRLESALGVTLCDRTRRPVTLTEARQTVLERCRRVLDAVRDVRSSSEGAQAPARELRIGVAHALTEVTLTQPVERVQRRFPRVSLCLSTGWTRDLLERVRARTLDGAVILLPDDERMPAGLDATRLGRERLVVVGAREGRAPRFDGMASLGDVGWILNPEGCAARALLQRALLTANVRMRVAVETYTYDLQLALVARQRGLSLVPARILARSPLRPRLRVRRIRGLDFPLTIWAVRSPATPDLDAVWGELHQALTERLAGPPRRSTPGGGNRP
jgi:DNA-binding transcriptional LysR family regulator